jgi:hypothetical protein
VHKQIKVFGRSLLIKLLVVMLSFLQPSKLLKANSTQILIFFIWFWLRTNQAVYVLVSVFKLL